MLFVLAFGFVATVKGAPKKDFRCVRTEIKRSPDGFNLIGKVECVDINAVKYRRDQIGDYCDPDDPNRCSFCYRPGGKYDGTCATGISGTPCTDGAAECKHCDNRSGKCEIGPPTRSGETKCKVLGETCGRCDYKKGKCIPGGDNVFCNSDSECTTCYVDPKTKEGRCGNKGSDFGGGDILCEVHSQCKTRCDENNKCTREGKGAFCNVFAGDDFNDKYCKDKSPGGKEEEGEAEETAAISEYSLLVDTLASNKGLNSLGSLLIALIPIIIFRKRWFG